MEQEKRDSVKSLGKALQLIDIINQARTPMTLMRLSQVSGFPKSTVYALLNTLRSYDCIRQGSDGRYYLGMRLFEWGCGVSASWELNNVARPYLEKLAAHTDATALLSRIEGNSVVVIDQSTAMCGGIYVTTEIGTHLPLHATSQRKLLLAVILLPRQAQAAGIATDDLRIRVGYFGMDVDEYVDVDTYHWSQLESDLPPAPSGVHLSAQWRRRGIPGGGGLRHGLLHRRSAGLRRHQHQRRAVHELLYEGSGDGVFHLLQSGGAFAVPPVLLRDLPAHLIPLYDEDGNFQGYDDSEAWQYAIEVRPMLALEDSWVTYQVGTEHVSEDFNSMGTANRFRLLFGQTSPTESRTNQTAKYVYAVNVVLDGQPEIVEEMKPLEGTIGSHKTSMTLSVGDLTILKNLQQLLRFDSSDGTVLRIDGWTVTPDSTYSDLVTVEISYTVLKEGTASINGNMGGLTLNTAAAVEVPKTDVPAEPDNTEEPGEPDKSDKPNEDGVDGEDGEGREDAENGENREDSEAGQTEPGGTPDGSREQPGNATVSEHPKADGSEKGQMIPLSAELSALLEQLGSDQGQHADTPQNQADSAPTAEPKDDRAILLYTGLGALAVCLCGAAAETIYFKRERAR